MVEAIVAVIAIVLALASMIMSLLQKPPQPPTTDQALEVPVTELGKPLPVIFGEVLIKDVNIAWWGKLKIVKKPFDMGGK
jgi:hypothetical protein